MWAMGLSGRSKPGRECSMKALRHKDTKTQSKNKFILFFVSLCLWVFVLNQGARGSATPAKDVLQRLIGDRASGFTFEQIPVDNGNDVYEIEAHDGKVIVRGNTPISMSRGAYAYLREACHCMVGWEGQHVELPEKLPDFAKTRVV